MFHGDSFGQELHNPFAFDFSENYKPLETEPMSPSSVATTPTTSEQPVAVSDMVMSYDNDVVSYSDDDYDVLPPTTNPQKKLRRSYTVPANVSMSVSSSSTGDRNGRKKKYDAPPGVWRNSGGFISTVYINKKRVYGPLRRDVSDAVRDREEMLIAKSVINTEEGMRAFVQAMKERCGVNRVSVCISDAINSAQEMVSSIVPHSGPAASASSLCPALESVRVSNRPLRAAAKRNIYVSSNESVTDFHDNVNVPASYFNDSDETSTAADNYKPFL